MPYDVNIGDGAGALGQNQLTDALDGTYWVSGWDATLGTGDLEVDIAAGGGAVEGADVSTGSTQTIDFTGDPDPTDPRKAVIYVDSGGTVQKSLGTPQPVDPTGEIRFRTYNPSPPASPPGVVVAEVWLDAGETVLETADVRDRRVSNDAAATVPTIPIKRVLESTALDGSEANVSTDGVNISNGSATLRGNLSTQPINVDSGNGENANEAGFSFTPKDKPTLLSVTKDNFAGTGPVTLERVSDGQVLDTVSNVAGLDTATFDTSQTEGGVKYAIYSEYDNGGTRYSIDQTTPIETSNCTVNDPWYNGSEGAASADDPNGIYEFNDFNIDTVGLEGSLTISWPAPADRASWDIASYQRTLDGASVQVDLLDGGGSVLQSDVPSPADISSENANQLQVKASLSRSSDANNPSFDYAALRFER